MSGIRSYDLNGDQVKAVHAALLGDETERQYWIVKFHNWMIYRNRQMEILRHAEQWFKDYALQNGVHLLIGDDFYVTPEDKLESWVQHQMEYASGLCWDVESQKVIVNKYASSRPMLSKENTNALLDYITQHITQDDKINEN